MAWQAVATRQVESDDLVRWHRAHPIATMARPHNLP